MTRAGVAGVAVLLVTSIAAGMIVTPQATAGGSLTQSSGGDFDRTIYTISIHQNGSATWTLEHQRRLANETEVDRFEDFARNFRNNDTALYTNFVNGSRSLVAGAADETGRSMTATAFEKDAVTRMGPTLNNRGIVEMSFRWSNFATVSGDTVHVGDVFGDGLYLEPNQRLEIVAGPNLAFENATPDPDDSSNETLATSEKIWWFGERSFDPTPPRVQLAVGGDGTGTGETRDETMLVVAVFVLAIGLAAAAAWHSGGPGAILTTIFGESQSSPSRAGTSAGAGTGVTEDELLSDSDRVIKLLEENGGRMKQVNIVNETDWSKSKVSMLLSDMDEEGEISKLRVGRENIVSLAGHEPDAAGSPFEDD